MNSRIFSEAMGELDGKYICEALNCRKKSRKFSFVKWGSIAACACLLIIGGYLYQAENRYPVRVLTDMSGFAGEVAEVPRWDDMEVYQQYSEITVDDTVYYATSCEISAEQIDVQISDDSVANGWDESADVLDENAERSCYAAVYEITNISTECAVAVQYEGSDVCYTAVNVFYRPETLGQFIEDLDLENNLVVNWASYEYNKPISGYSTVRFENIDANMVLELLLSNTSAANEYDDLLTDRPEEIMDICVSLPLLGYENKSISVREDGYIITNILSTGKMFCVGEENTKAFVEYVLEECDGYEVVYSFSSDEDVPE